MKEDKLFLTIGIIAFCVVMYFEVIQYISF